MGTMLQLLGFPVVLLVIWWGLRIWLYRSGYATPRLLWYAMLATTVLLMTLALSSGDPLPLLLLQGMLLAPMAMAYALYRWDAWDGSHDVDESPPPPPRQLTEDDPGWTEFAQSIKPPGEE